MCPLSGSNRLHLVGTHAEHDLQVLYTVRVVLFAGTTFLFPFERLLDDRRFPFLDLKNPPLDCVFDLGNDR